MKHELVAVFDQAAASFARPFAVPTIGLAERSFSDEVNRAGSDMNAHPEDYSLHKVGEFDDESGSVTACSPAVRLVTAKQVLKSAS